MILATCWRTVKRCVTSACRRTRKWRHAPCPDREMFLRHPDDMQRGPGCERRLDRIDLGRDRSGRFLDRGHADRVERVLGLDRGERAVLGPWAGQFAAEVSQLDRHQRERGVRWSQATRILAPE